ncbi:nascent polypeptide-associated complex subunit alpha, muscle-specific form-like isoform X2 [Paramacrobiotus metropolitanus]|uniref:nascent polypeptide-associated complex subunit alpha, muscle-specific form-like isoform X2 n=1 Tax=Paramacrobiotus metropolitanus TaxID=2943436 RepID=UPI0024456072|nr:nascent polypeptide-associated complex subunit alpha, muscle-specific form-like isoform X2 [Paramacrobiotus metropolitanus]
MQEHEIADLQIETLAKGDKTLESYLCRVCGLKLNQRFSMRRHVKIEHPDKMRSLPALYPVTEYYQLGRLAVDDSSRGPASPAKAGSASGSNRSSPPQSVSSALFFPDDGASKPVERKMQYSEWAQSKLDLYINAVAVNQRLLTGGYQKTVKFHCNLCTAANKGVQGPGWLLREEAQDHIITSHPEKIQKEASGVCQPPEKKAKMDKNILARRFGSRATTMMAPVHMPMPSPTRRARSPGLETKKSSTVGVPANQIGQKNPRNFAAKSANRTPAKATEKPAVKESVSTPSVSGVRNFVSSPPLSSGPINAVGKKRPILSDLDITPPGTPKKVATEANYTSPSPANLPSPSSSTSSGDPPLQSKPALLPTPPPLAYAPLHSLPSPRPPLLPTPKLSPYARSSPPSPRFTILPTPPAVPAPNPQIAVSSPSHALRVETCGLPKSGPNSVPAPSTSSGNTVQPSKPNPLPGSTLPVEKSLQRSLSSTSVASVESAQPVKSSPAPLPSSVNAPQPIKSGPVPSTSSMDAPPPPKSPVKEKPPVPASAGSPIEVVPLKRTSVSPQKSLQRSGSPSTLVVVADAAENGKRDAAEIASSMKGPMVESAKTVPSEPVESSGEPSQRGKTTSPARPLAAVAPNVKASTSGVSGKGSNDGVIGRKQAGSSVDGMLLESDDSSKAATADDSVFKQPCDPDALQPVGRKGLFVCRECWFGPRAQAEIVQHVLTTHMTRTSESRPQEPEKAHSEDSSDWVMELPSDTAASPSKRRGRPRKAQTMARVDSKSSSVDAADWVMELPSDSQRLPPPPKPRGRPRKDAPSKYAASTASQAQDKSRGVSLASSCSSEPKKKGYKGAREVKALQWEYRSEDDDEEDWATEINYAFTREDKKFMLDAAGRSGVSIRALCAKFTEATMRHCTETGEWTDRYFIKREGGSC